MRNVRHDLSQSDRYDTEDCAQRGHHLSVYAPQRRDPRNIVLEMFGKGRRSTGIRSPSDLSTCTDIEKCVPADESSNTSNKSPIAALPTSTTPILGPNPIPAPKTGMIYWLKRTLLHRADGDAGKPPTSSCKPGGATQTSISSNDYPMDYAKYCGDTALVWKLYLTRAEHDDGALAQVLNGDLESLLLFATLFSAILSAFLIEIRSVRDTENPANSTPSNWVNGLWLFSLLFGVLSAFLASLAKGWVSKYLYSSDGGENWAAVNHRQNQFEYRKRVIFIVQLLPLPLHASLLFFSVGFLIYLRDDSLGIRVVVAIVVGAMIIFYFAMSFYPLLSRYSPFDTPLTTSTQWMLKPWRPPKQHSERAMVISSQHHSREWGEEEIKATALAWLLETSVDKNTIRESVYGVAGLSVNGEIQAALGGGLVARTLILSFTDTMEDSDPTSPTPYLHALLRLLHPERAKIPESVLRLFIPSLDKLTALDRGTYEIALFVRARILLLLDDERTVLAELRDTAIPILQKCSGARIFGLLSHLEDNLRVIGGVPSPTAPTNPKAPKFICCPATIHTQDAQILVELMENGQFRKEFVHENGIRLLNDLPHVAWKKIITRLMEDEEIFKLATVPISSVEVQLAWAIQARLRADVEACVETVNELVQKDRIPERIATAGVIDQMITTASNKKWRVRQRSVEVLGRLARFRTEGKKAMELIVSKLNDEDEDVREVGVQTLGNLAEAFRTEGPRIIELIVNKFNDEDEGVREASVQTLGNLAEAFQTNDLMINHMISLIVSKLRDESDDVALTSTEAVIKLAEQENARGSIFLHDIISQIVDNSNRGGWDLQQRSVEALGDLAKYRDFQKECDHVAGSVNASREALRTDNTMIIESIVNKFKDDDDAVREASVQTLGNLAEAFQTNDLMINHMISLIVSKLRDESDDVALTSTEAVIKLAEQEKIREGIIRHDIMNEIIENTNRGDWTLQLRSVQALGDLVKCHKFREDGDYVMKLANAIVEKMRDTDEDVRAASVHALGDLMMSNDVLTDGGTITNALTALVETLSDWNDDVRSTSMKALSDLSMNGSFLKEPVINAMADKLKSGDGLACTEAVLELARQGENRSAFMSPTIINQVIVNTNDDDWSVRQASLQVLGKLATLDSNDGTMAEKIINAVVSKFNDGDEDVRAASLEALGELITHDSDALWKDMTLIDIITRKILKMSTGSPGRNHTEQVGTQHESPMIPPAISDETDENMSWVVQHISLQALGKLAMNGEFRKRLLTHIHTIIEIFEGYGGNVANSKPEIEQTMLELAIHLGIPDAEIEDDKVAEKFELNRDPMRNDDNPKGIDKITSGLQSNHRFLRIVSTATVMELAKKDKPAQESIATREIIKGIVAGTTDGNGHVREMSIQVLGKLAKYGEMWKDNVTPKELLNVIVKGFIDKDEGVREASVLALGELAKCGPPTMIDKALVVRATAQHLIDVSDTVKKDALHVLKKLAEPPALTAVVNALVKLAKDGTREIAIASVIFPRIFSHTKEKAQQQQTNAKSTNVELQNVDASEESRVRALVNLVKSEDTRNHSIALGVVFSMVQGLRHDDTAVRQANARGLGELATFESFWDQPQRNVNVNNIDQKSGQKSFQLQVECIKAISELVTKDGLDGQMEKEIENVVDLLNDSNLHVQQATAEVLGVMAGYEWEFRKNKHAIESLCKLVEDHKNKNSRVAAVKALIKFKLEDDDLRWKVIPVMAEVLGNTGDSANTCSLEDLKKVLVKFEDITKLLEHANNSNDRVRLEVLKTLPLLSEYLDQLTGNLPESIVTMIINHLRPDNPPLRRAGLDALSSLAKFLDQSTIIPEHILAIIDMLGNKDLLVRDSSVKALSNLGAIVVSPNLLQQLMNQLDKKDALLAQSIAAVFENLAETAGFGQRLPTDFWDKVAQWLTQPQTGTSGLRALRAFAKQENLNLKEEIRESVIVPALLEMRRSSTSWHAGTIGLLYLGLFDAESH